MRIAPAVRRAWKRGDAFGVLVDIDHPLGRILAHSGTGIRRVAGMDWFGLGVLGGISAVERSLAPAVRTVRFTVLRVPQDAGAMLTADVQGRPARVYLAAVGPRNRTTVDLDEPVIDARLDVQELSSDPASGTAGVALNGESGFIDLDRADQEAWSDAQHRRDYPGSTGLARMGLLQGRQSRWRITD